MIITRIASLSRCRLSKIVHCCWSPQRALCTLLEAEARPILWQTIQAIAFVWCNSARSREADSSIPCPPSSFPTLWSLYSSEVSSVGITCLGVTHWKWPQKVISSYSWHALEEAGSLACLSWTQVPFPNVLISTPFIEKFPRCRSACLSCKGPRAKYFKCWVCGRNSVAKHEDLRFSLRTHVKTNKQIKGGTWHITLIPVLGSLAS